MATHDQLQTVSCERLLRWPEVKHRVGISRSQVELLIKIGTFPAPIKIGARSTAWLQSSIDEWITSRIAESSKGHQP